MTHTAILLHVVDHTSSNAVAGGISTTSAYFHRQRACRSFLRAADGQVNEFSRYMTEPRPSLSLAPVTDRLVRWIGPS